MTLPGPVIGDGVCFTGVLGVTTAPGHVKVGEEPIGCIPSVGSFFSSGFITAAISFSCY